MMAANEQVKWDVTVKNGWNGVRPQEPHDLNFIHERPGHDLVYNLGHILE